MAFVSVSSEAIRIKGVGAADFAVLGLNTSVFVSLYSEGTVAALEGASCSADFQDEGSVVTDAWERDPCGSILQDANAESVVSRVIECSCNFGFSGLVEI